VYHDAVVISIDKQYLEFKASIVSSSARGVQLSHFHHTIFHKVTHEVSVVISLVGIVQSTRGMIFQERLIRSIPIGISDGRYVTLML
jgi:hypothetical protein